MENFIKCFVRDQHGAWRCIAPADIYLPQGRVQIVPGTVLIQGSRFMNVDVAALLEKQYRTGGNHPR